MDAKKKKGIISVLLILFLSLFLSFTSPVSAAPSQPVSKGNTTEKVVALTFDDGADGTNVSSILQILSSHNVTATFFLTGSGASHHGQQIRDIANQGHQIANHSYSHPYFTQISAAEIRSQLQRTEDLVRQLTGKTTKPYFRPPYGAYNSTVLQHIGDAGYTHTIMWTIDTIDWTGNSANDIVQRVMNGITPGAIILMHTGEGAPGTPQALPTIITRLRNMGYRFVTVSEMLNYSSAPDGEVYTVRAGDTLSRIARRYGVSVHQIASANGISNINYLSIGQTLIIPGTGGGSTPPPTTPLPSSTRYTVQAGDTLYSIARRHAVTVQQVVSANNIRNANLIRVGQVLTIPGSPGEGGTPPPSNARYTVRAGDTLYRIALRHGVTVQQIVSENNIRNANLIRVGQVLAIPGSSGGESLPPPTMPPTTTRYTVRAGDTLFNISRRFGVAVQQIATANRLANPNFIRVGQVLVIP